MDEITKGKIKIACKVVIPIVIALISIFVVTGFATSTKFNKNTIQALDDKKTTVLELTAASTAASAAITLIPGDVATPIAQKLADLSGYFVIVLCAIFLEKYLITITGYVTFMFLIPAACVLFSANVFWKNDVVKVLERKMFFFGMAIVLVIPASVKASSLIEATYQESINSTIDSAKKTTDEVTNSSSDGDEGILAGIVSSVKSTVSLATEKVKSILNNFIEALAVLIVTSCIIPILVMIFFIWLINTIIGTNINPAALKAPKVKLPQKSNKEI